MPMSWNVHTYLRMFTSIEIDDDIVHLKFKLSTVNSYQACVLGANHSDIETIQILNYDSNHHPKYKWTSALTTIM